MSVLDEYVMKYPSIQNAIDVFAGEWASSLPGEFSSGGVPLFNDPRIKLIEETIGGFAGKNILELGPLEAGHTHMMLERGASSVLAIEANSRAYFRCLMVKDIFNLADAKFLLGDFDPLLKTDETKYDFILAMGVIYHCANPVKTIVNMTRRADEIGIWSHYFKEDQVRPKYGEKFDYDGFDLEYEGYRATAYKHEYRDALEGDGFCGGGNPSTLWMDRESWFSLFDELGFDLTVLTEDENHPNGPDITAVAKRRKETVTT